jgi:hypothetical protein
MEDDPRRRRPDISVAFKYLKWKPKVSLMEGLNRTVEYFRKELNRINGLNSNSDDLSYEDSFYLSQQEEAELNDKNYHTEL